MKYETIKHANGTTERTWINDTPIVRTPTPIRVITVRALMNRLAQSERIAIRASIDDIVIDMMEDLRLASYVNLDDARLTMGLSYLNGLGLVAAEQVTNVLVNGTSSEAYRGVL